MNAIIKSRMVKIENDISEIISLISDEMQKEYENNPSDISANQLLDKVILDKLFICQENISEVMDLLKLLGNKTSLEIIKYLLEQNMINYKN